MQRISETADFINLHLKRLALKQVDFFAFNWLGGIPNQLTAKKSTWSLAKTLLIIHLHVLYEYYYDLITDKCI